MELGTSALAGVLGFEWLRDAIICQNIGIEATTTPRGHGLPQVQPEFRAHERGAITHPCLRWVVIRHLIADRESSENG